MPRRNDLQLSRDLIAETALALLRDGGLPAVSTRKVAAALGASPMSLYVHVGSKQGLLDAVFERLMGSIKIDLDSEAPWTAQAEQWVHALRQQLSQHPDVMSLMHGRRWGFVRSSEPLIRALLAAGFSEDAAVRATRLLTWSTIGFLTVAAGASPNSNSLENAPQSDVARSLSRLEALEGGRAARSAAATHGVDQHDIDTLFVMQVRMLIDGLATLGNDDPSAR